jgi:hypothetical protein
VAIGIAGFRIVQIPTDHVDEAESLDLADLTRALSPTRGDSTAVAARPECAAWVAYCSDNIPCAALTLRETPCGGLATTRFDVDQVYLHTEIIDRLIDYSHRWAEDAGYQFIESAVCGDMVLISDALRRNGYCEREPDGGVKSSDSRCIYRRFIQSIGAHIAGPVIPNVDTPDLAVVIERPRGYVEGWHWDTETSSFVLREYYDRPVPVNYGFTPSYRNPADGDYLDVIVLDDAHMSPGDVIICRGTGVLRRPDGDHKLLAVPIGGATIPIDIDAAYRERVANWWPKEKRPTSWDGPEAIELLLASCIHIED